MTVDAHAFIYHFREMISLDIKCFGHPQNVARTVVNAVFAALAALLDNDHFALTYLDDTQVKGLSPKSHLGSL